jgi:hypothetical protein
MITAVSRLEAAAYASTPAAVAIPFDLPPPAETELPKINRQQPYSSFAISTSSLRGVFNIAGAWNMRMHFASPALGQTTADGRTLQRTPVGDYARQGPDPAGFLKLVAQTDRSAS